MSKIDLFNTATRAFHKVGFQFKKHSPEILVTVGVVGVVASTVLACKATTKLGDILDKTKEDVDNIHKVASGEMKLPEGTEYTEEDSKKDLAIVYAQTGVKVVKLYGPAIALGAFSIVSILASNNILRKRNVALSAAYTLVSKGFKEYRERVVDRFGKELDHELRYNIKAQEIEETVIDEKGKEKTVKSIVNVVNPNDLSLYARMWDDGNTGWTKDPQYNLMMLRRIQDYANKTLQLKGHLFLNEVYDLLGFPRVKEGQVVGWVYNEKNPVGDNFVDFNIYDGNREAARNFVNGHERSILLDFNVDGDILNLI